MKTGTRARPVVLALAAIGWLAPAPCVWADAAEAPKIRVESLGGEEIELRTLLEKGPVVVDFWATWCKPCVKSLAEIQSLHEELGPRGLSVVGVSIDGPRNYPKVRPFAARLGLTFPLVLDTDGDLQRDFGVTGVPTAVLIEPGGTIALVKQGYRKGESAKLRDAILALLPTDEADEPPDDAMSMEKDG